jgi:hypothetical protein
MPRRTQGDLKIIRKATVTNAIYQNQNQTKNSKMGNLLQMGPKLAVLFCTPFFNFWAQGKYPCAGQTWYITTYQYTSAVQKVSDHFEYLKNRSRSLDVTWQPVREDLTVFP